MVPEFAIMGHPNEGKSSVLSTLAEDDSVRVSDTPGETTECRTFPVVIDGQEILRFTDTPGFQNPGRVLSELKQLTEASTDPLATFQQDAEQYPELNDDRELLSPLSRGAGIIYVVDGSRPVRNVDRAEMEILRLTGKPRMAIINCKADGESHLLQWKNEFRKNFNSNRLFNAHRATYAERIDLLEALKSIDQDWQRPLALVVDAFKKDWAARNLVTADIIATLLTDCLSLKMAQGISSQNQKDEIQKSLFGKYKNKLNVYEKSAHQKIRSLFKHNIFDYELPVQSVLRADLFDARGWQLFGLSKKQIVIAGGLGGAAIGAGLDIAALGHGLGMFTAVGSVAGALGALFGGESVSNKAKIIGIPLGGEELQIGPAKSIGLLFVLLNRSLLYYQHTINWAHGRRDYLELDGFSENTMSPQGYTKNWSTKKIKICNDFFNSINSSRRENALDREKKFRELILSCLQEISESKVLQE